MMEQGSLADLLTLAKSGDDNKLGEMMAMMNGGMGGQQWMWWILIILFAFGGFGNGICDSTYAITNAVRDARDAAPYAGSCYWYSGTGYGQSVPEPAGIL